MLYYMRVVAAFAACLEQLVSEAASRATGYNWDVCTVEFYGPNRYNAGALLAGNNTHFEPQICIVSNIIDCNYHP
jgi:hypothetical protein